MPQIADILIANANLTLGYAESLLKNIDPKTFARHPVVGGKAIETNHPAFVFGHLSTYLARVAGMIGKEGAVPPAPAGFEELFKNGKPCLDDRGGTIYPSMQAITDYFFKGSRALIEAVSKTDDAVFARPNPAEGRMRERFPTVGGMVAFMMATHPMSHLGQVSAWRRCMGLGSAM